VHQDPEVRVRNIRFDRVTRSEAGAIVEAFARQRLQPKYVCMGDLENLRLADSDVTYARTYEDADLVLADGHSIVLLSHLTGHPIPERISSRDLVQEVGRISMESNCRVFLLGGCPGSATRAGDFLRKKYPGTNIVGQYSPPNSSFDCSEEQTGIRTAVRSCSPDILLVALDSPKQEKWIRANLLELNVPVTLGVGQAFERVPVTTIKFFRRYIVNAVPFLSKAVLMMSIQRLVSVFASPVTTEMMSMKQNGCSENEQRAGGIHLLASDGMPACATTTAKRKYFKLCGYACGPIQTCSQCKRVTNGQTLRY